MRFTIPIGKLRKSPFVGPRGGLWADSKHTVHWDPKKHGEPKPTFVAADLITSDEMSKVVAKVFRTAEINLVASSSFGRLIL